MAEDLEPLRFLCFHCRVSTSAPVDAEFEGPCAHNPIRATKMERPLGDDDGGHCWAPVDENDEPLPFVKETIERAAAQIIRAKIEIMVSRLQAASRDVAAKAGVQ